MMHDVTAMKRAGYATFGLTCAALGVYLIVTQHGSWWPFIFFVIAPDLTFLLGFQSGLQRGQLAPRAVPFYNAAHRLWAPVVLVALSLVLGAPTWAAAGLAWCGHIGIDRSLGFTLRTPDGFFQSAG
jgi:Domain of unknown function (DUF4260)